MDTNMHAKRNGYSFSCREVNFFRSGMDLFIQEVKKAEQDLKLAEQQAQKQVKEAEAKKAAAEQEAEAELIKAQKAAEAKRVEADALAYYNAKVAQNYQVEIRLKELEIQLERAKRWDGRQVPEYVPLTAAGGIVNLPAARE